MWYYSCLFCPFYFRVREPGQDLWGGVVRPFKTATKRQMYFTIRFKLFTSTSLWILSICNTNRCRESVKSFPWVAQGLCKKLSVVQGLITLFSRSSWETWINTTFVQTILLVGNNTMYCVDNKYNHLCRFQSLLFSIFQIHVSFWTLTENIVRIRNVIYIVIIFCLFQWSARNLGWRNSAFYAAGRFTYDRQLICLQTDALKSWGKWVNFYFSLFGSRSSLPHCSAFVSTVCSSPWACDLVSILYLLILSVEDSTVIT